jgi:glucose/arabinose dehydrogenase
MKNHHVLNGNSLRSAYLFSIKKSLLFLIAVLLIIIQSCKKNDTPPLPPGSQVYDLQLVSDNLVSPVTVVEAPDDSHRLFIVDQSGKIWIINADGTKVPDPFIDISSELVALTPAYDERGLLGLAFHPDYKTNGKFYLFYTAPPNAGGPDATHNWDNLTRVSEFTVSPDANHADLSSEKHIFEANHPEFNHDGGTIAFGPDGYLYISIGDGGNADDVGPGHVAGGNGQDITQNLLGNILRIDVNTTSTGKNYGIPADNPFSSGPGLPEIYAYGFRNPYRFSFDLGGDHNLYAGDAGQSLYEEVDKVDKGGDYGWNIKEGTHCFDPANDLVSPASCAEISPGGAPLIDPVIEVPNSANPAGGKTIAIVGGCVYRGNTIQSLTGQYLFGSLSADFTSETGEIFMATPGGSALWTYSQLKLKSFPNNLGQYLKGFGQDISGEVYVVTSSEVGPQGATGKVFKLVLGL